MKFRSIEHARDIIKSSNALVKEAGEYIKQNTITEKDIFPGAVFCFKGYEECPFEEIVLMFVCNKNGEYYLSGLNKNNPCIAWGQDLKTKQDILNYFKESEINFNMPIIKAPYKIKVEKV